MDDQPKDRILRLPEVIDRTGKSRSGIYADVKAGSFPRPVSIGARAVGWKDSAIEGWLGNRPPAG